MPDRSDVIQSFARFTPDVSHLDRDALLFNAGRASAPRRSWLFALIGLLALSQAATLIWLWPQKSVPVVQPVIPSSPTLTLPVKEEELSPLPPHSLAHAQQVLQQTGELAQLEPITNLRPDSMALTVRSRGVWE